jgi:signal transduction histidine kinase
VRWQSWLVAETRRSPVAEVTAGVLAVAACTLLIYPLRAAADPVSLDIVYIPAILLVAAGWGARVGILTAIASAAAFDFFHLPPAGFSISGSENAGSLVVFTVAALMGVGVADLTDRLRAAEERRMREAQSRARVITAADEERRRVVRDLHNGAQQRLVHAVITLKLARRALHQGDETADDLVNEALGHTEQATAELRELAHGILPSVLTRGGLRAGVESLVSRVSLPVTVDVSGERFAPAIEATAYFIVSEALTNVIKHSHAHSAEIRAYVVGRMLRVEISDDGIGGARLESGTGLLGLDDRVAALDGHLRVESPPGGGTLIAASLPRQD